MSKKIIAVVPLWDDEKQSIWMLPEYMESVKESGGLPIILPLTCCEEDIIELFEKCDGLLMTGGQDVSPALFNERRHPRCGAACEARDIMETVLYKRSVSEDKPVLGICRGIQLINVIEGGTLYQHIPYEYETNVEHVMKPPYTDVVHYVNIEEGTLLYDIIGEKRSGVNSFHHQAVKNLGNNLKINAISQDGLIEAVQREGNRFIMAVQWHPEYSFNTDINSRKIFKAFIDACS